MLIYTVFCVIMAAIFITASPDAESNVTESCIKEPTNEILKQNLNLPPGLFYYTDSNKFYVSKDAKIWDIAALLCKNNGMVLASITSQKEQLELLKFLFVNDLEPQDDQAGYWLSGRQTDNMLYNWTSVNKQMDCWGWLPNEPNNEDAERCVEIKIRTQSVRIGWNNELCEKERRFICQPLPNPLDNDLVKQQEQPIKNPEIKDQNQEVKDQNLEVNNQNLEVKDQNLEGKDQNLKVHDQNPGVKNETPKSKQDTSCYWSYNVRYAYSPRYYKK